MAHLACPSAVAVNQDLRGQDDLWKLVTPHDLHAVGDGGSCPEGPTTSTVPAYTRRPLVAFSRRDALWYVLIPRHRQVVDPMDIPPKEIRRKAAGFPDHARRRRRPVIGCRTDTRFLLAGTAQYRLRCVQPWNRSMACWRTSLQPRRFHLHTANEMTNPKTIKRTLGTTHSPASMSSFRESPAKAFPGGVESAASTQLERKKKTRKQSRTNMDFMGDAYVETIITGTVSGFQRPPWQHLRSDVIHLPRSTARIRSRWLIGNRVTAGKRIEAFKEHGHVWPLDTKPIHRPEERFLPDVGI